ncbi:MAG TPA: bifunctional (p)ppGpp synthetase/guanosine-3',5'-bis(diphosphate) 3'-pyrophosphohydrolase [Alphaproteobacteria bacterium]|nr:bifunctional (p)ppGpp synthetase/guanosine-3',5'-bis(diphosphate) 3'-pyrophosphohydrolase [Alphaproteobacteria bacterium]
MIRQFELIEAVKAYDPHVDEDLLNRAYVYTVKAHGSQQRASGDPYFSHPVEVAGILTKYKLDSDTIATALLHDTVEDTLATLEDIEAMFGKDVARLVDGVTKLSRIELQSDATKQAENFRKLVLAMSEDIRVLLVKLADRLHNMRTLSGIPKPEKRDRIAHETMEIYAPLAARIGMHDLQTELEDLAFAQLNPDARDSILARLEFLRERGGEAIPRILKALKDKLKAEGIEAQVSGREKKAHSVWRKMQVKNVGFEQLSDIMAFRIVVPSEMECYHALGVIHSAYSVVPGRFKDYISLPKINGYRSLHTAVYGPENQRIEVQIRTTDMHEIAEAGVAAHWAYKQGERQTGGRKYRWLQELLDILEHAGGPEEFLEHTKLEMFKDQVFAFTPAGELIALPHGATTVDFAYAVHSEIGDTTVGAKVNGRMVPLRTELNNGDQVEIITSRAQTPSPEWDRFVITGKARARIRRFVRAQQRQQYAGLGRAMLEKAFRQAGHEFAVKAVDGVRKTFHADETEDIYAMVGDGTVSTRELIDAIFPGEKNATGQGGKVVPLPKRVKSKGESGAVPITGLIPGMAVHYAGCCHPLPGDRIVGIITTGKGVTIHTIDCETLEAFSSQPERWLDVGWDAGASGLVTRISVIVGNEPGALGDLSSIIGKNDGNISNLKITSRDQDFFEMIIDIEVRDVRHLTDIIAALRATPVINSVARALG